MFCRQKARQHLGVVVTIKFRFCNNSNEKIEERNAPNILTYGWNCPIKALNIASNGNVMKGISIYSANLHRKREHTPGD